MGGGGDAGLELLEDEVYLLMDGMKCCFICFL